MRLHNRINREELKRQLLEDQTARTTLSFYRYAHILDPQKFRDNLYLRWQPLGVLGRIYVAKEGVNGQISLPTDQLEAFKETLNEIDFLQNLRLNIAIEDDGKSFFKLTIKVRHKIVADGLDDASFDVTRRGQHLSAEAFNELTEDPNTVVVDMRNHYESEVGHFEGAITPDVETFREALPHVVEMLSDKKEQPIVMYCTGGIRCEKASAYLKHQGFEKVYQLDGGIIEYARQAAAHGLRNKFLGKNFVFDERLGERISEDVLAHCHQCGAPCDTHVNCANDACHLLFIQCPECAEKFQHCCSTVCSDFIALPEEEKRGLRVKTLFNGIRYGKGGHYKAFKRGEGGVLA